MALIHNHIRKNGPASRANTVELIAPHMPAGSTHEQCIDKVDNLMRKMKGGYGIYSQPIEGWRDWVLP